MKKLFLTLLVVLSLALGVVPALAVDAPVSVMTVAQASEEMLRAYLNNLPEGFGLVSADNLSLELVENPPFLIDVREPADYAGGFIEGAVNIPIREFLQHLDALPGLDEPIVIYCASGHRGALAQMALHLLGYTNVRNLGGGLRAWTNAQYPVVTEPAVELATGEAPEVDAALLEELDAYLSALPEGFGTISADNLNVALLEDPPFLIDVREPNEYAEGFIEGAVNIPIRTLLDDLSLLPAEMDAPIVIYCASGHRGALGKMALELLGYENVLNLGGGLRAWTAAEFPVVMGEAGAADLEALLGGYLSALPENFLTITATDLSLALAENPPFLLDVREPNEYAEGFIEGAINIPVREVLQNLAALPMDQRIVIYCGSGHRGALASMALNLLGYDTINLASGLNAWRAAELPLVTEPVPAVEAGEAPEVDAELFALLNDYLSNLPQGFGTISAENLNIALAENAPFLLDVREPGEYAQGFIEGAVNIPVREVVARLAELPAPDQPIVIYCGSGHRGALAQLALNLLGYTDVRNLGGGLRAWTAAEYPVVTE